LFETDKDRDVLQQDLIAVGLFGIQDPLRNTIVESVNTVVKAGIRVIMCTGDNIDTATAISVNAKIITPEEVQNSIEATENYNKGQADDRRFARMEGEQFRTELGGLIKVQDPEHPDDPEKLIDAVKH